MKTLTIIKLMILLGIIFLTVGLLKAQVDPFDYMGGQILPADTSHNHTFSGSAPSAPSLTTPINDSASVPLNANLIWGTSATATYYTLRVWNSTDTVIIENLATSPYSLTGQLDYYTEYSWKVGAGNAYGLTYSSTRTFTTALEPLQNIFARSRILSDSGLFVVYNSLKDDNPLYSAPLLSIIKRDSPKKWYTSQDNGLTWDFQQNITETHAGCLYQGYYLDDNREFVGYWSRIDVQPHYTYHVVKSSDGITWDSGYGVVNFDVRGTEVGEDATFLSDGSNYVFFRDSTTQQAPYSAINAGQCPTRTISFGQIIDNNTVSDRQRIIPTTLNNFYNINSKDYRTCWNNMTVVKIDADYWGFANTIRSHSSAKENQTGSTSDTVTVRIYHSVNLTNWTPINDTVSAIQLHGNRKQIFTQQPVVIGDSLIVFAEESDSRHNTTDGTTPYWAWTRYAIYIPTLNLYKP